MRRWTKVARVICKRGGVAVVGALVVTSCKKQKEPYTSEDYFAGETYSAELNRQIGDVLTTMGTDKSFRLGTAGSFQLTSHCAKITVTHEDSASWFPVVYTVDFGTTNCQGHDGKLRRGKIVIRLTGRYRDKGTQITVTPQGYYVNDNKLEGQKVVTNMGRNEKNHIYFNISEELTITRTDGKIITWKSNRIREWIVGDSTVTPWDDEYYITGTGEGVNRNGIAFKANITKPIHVRLNCFWPVAGIVEIVPDGYKTRTLDFGDGTCDNEAVMTVGKKKIIIKL